MPRRIVDLNGADWQLGQSPVSTASRQAAWSELEQVRTWLPATVPGNVRADLIQAGCLPDLNFGLNPEDAQWVDDHDWWFVHRFPALPTQGQRVHLALCGVDYASDLFLNGTHLGSHEGMFSPQIHEISHMLDVENQLAVRVTGSGWLPNHRSAPREKLLNRLEARLGNIAERFPHRRDTLKCQMGFGWDFAPPLRTMGIWDDVFLVISEEVFIQEVQIGQQVTGDSATISIKVRVDTRHGGPALFRFSLTGETFESHGVVAEQRVHLRPDSSSHSATLVVPQPRLWWPWDHGVPNLYRLNITVWHDGRLLDATTTTVGLRHIELTGWRLRVNGQHVYVRGANWVPASILPGCVTKADYQALLGQARQANMNMLRVWGGGLREKADFYDLCDRMGILVWQEFPFACAFLTRFPGSREYVQLVESEAKAIVRTLRHHASLALWCGGNEFSPRRNAPLVTALEGIVAEEDPSRPFLPASPARGDSHNWQVWHQYRPPSDYREDQSLFASEFGFQAPPEAKTLRRFLPADALWPAGPAWAYHGAGLQKLWRYARPFLSSRHPDLESFVQASQRAQACGLQIAIEHYRRRKAQGCGGLLLWQLNEPWPAISWALLDFYRQPKPAYETVQRLYEPILISIEYPLQAYHPGDRFQAKVWMINDRARSYPGCQVQVMLWDMNRQPVEQIEFDADLLADSAQMVHSLNWTLPPGSDWLLTCWLACEGRTVTHNRYDLSVHDGIHPTWRQRLRSRLASLAMST